MAALFQSVTPRTAGIATVDYGQLTSHYICLSLSSSCLSGLVRTLQGAVLKSVPLLVAISSIVHIVQQPL